MFHHWLTRLSRRQLLLAAAVFAVAVFLCDTGLDFLMIEFSSTRRELLFISDAITALLAGGLMFWVLLIQRTRQAETHQRMEVIAEMNHHVRNALQVISYWGMQEADRTQLNYIAQAVDRIQWALEDILPRGIPNAALRRPASPEMDSPRRASNR